MPSGGFETDSGSSGGPPFCAMLRQVEESWTLPVLVAHATSSLSRIISKLVGT